MIRLEWRLRSKVLATGRLQLVKVRGRRVGHVVDLTAQEFAALNSPSASGRATVAPIRIVSGARPVLAWGYEHEFHRRARALFDVLRRGLWADAMCDWEKTRSAFCRLARILFDRSSPHIAFACATPSKYLAGRAAKEINGVLEDEPFRPRFLEKRIDRFDLGIRLPRLRADDLWDRFAYDTSGKGDEPVFVAMERRRTLVIPGRPSWTFREKTYCLGIQGEDDNDLNAGWIPGVNPWHDAGAMVTGVPTLILGTLRPMIQGLLDGRAEQFEVKDALIGLSPFEAAPVSITTGLRPFDMFLLINPIPRALLLTGGIIEPMT